MEQRPLRLGDIVDDYCPRERRVTNHAIVAMVEDGVKQTRCTTCDAEHAYKGGQAPRKRRKDSTSALYREVLAGMPDAVEVAAPAPSADMTVAEAPPLIPANGNGHSHEPVEAAAERPTAAERDSVSFDETVQADEDEAGPRDDGPIHRRLIRATLPRIEGQKEVRQTPDFTIRSNGNRPGGSYRGERMRGQGGTGAGSGMRAGGRRFGGNQPGQGSGRPGGGRNRPGFGGGSNNRGPSSGNQGRPQGGRKRSR
jgi:hypothetical protein